jgi:hypothetical protein
VTFARQTSDLRPGPETGRDALAENEAEDGNQRRTPPNLAGRVGAGGNDRPDARAAPRSSQRLCGGPVSRLPTASIPPLCAWAAANGLSVTPRGRMKDGVLAAYRAAGN